MASDAEVDLVVNASGALAEVERDLDRLVREAERSADPVTLAAIMDRQASLADVERDLNRLITAAEEGADDIDVAAVLNQRASLRAVQRDLNNLVNEAERTGAIDPITLAATFNSVGSLRNVRSGLDDMADTLRQAVPDVIVRADVDTDDADRNTRSLTDTFGRLIRVSGAVLGPLAKVAGGAGAVGLAIGGAVPLVAGLVTATESLLPAAAVGVSALLTVQLAAGALRLGMLGVGEAVSAAFDPGTSAEDLAKAMKALAPEARVFVKELRSMKGTFTALQLDVQNRLFKDLDDVLSNTARAVLPALERGLDSAASSFNTMARGVGAAASGLADSGILGTAIRSSENALRSLEAVPGQVVSSLSLLAAAAGPSLERIATAAAGVAERVSASLAGSFESGALERAIDVAVDNLTQLGRIAGNVFGGLGNIFGGLSADGQGLFSTLEQITQAFEDLTASKEFQSALGELSQTMSALVRAVLPLLSDAFKALLPLIEILAPPIRELITNLGVQLRPVIQALAPVLAALAGAFVALIPVITPIIDLGLQLITAVLPILTPLFEHLAAVFELWAPVIAQVAENIGAQLLPFLAEIPGILDQVLPLFIELGERLMPLLLDALIELSPMLAELGAAFAELLVELTPLLVKFLEFQIFLLDKMMPVIEPLAQLIAGVLVGALGALVTIIRELVIPIVQFIVALLEGDWSDAMQIAAQVVNTLRDNAVRAFQNLKDRVFQAVTQLAADVIRRAGEMARGFVSAIVELVNDAIDRFRALPQLILGALGSVGTLLFNAGADIVQGLINGIVSKIGELTSTLSGITSLIPDLKGPMDVDRVLLTPSGEAIMDGLIKGMRSQIPALRQELTGITGLIPQAAGPGMTMASSSLDARSPQVNVYVGNQLLNRHIDVRIDDANRRDTRILAQGVRR